MPIKIDADLPARSTLENENIFVMTQERAGKYVNGAAELSDKELSEREQLIKINNITRE